jgi:hypothetical protein
MHHGRPLNRVVSQPFAVTPITLRYDRRLVRDSVLTFWRRRVGVGFFVALAVVGGAVLFSVVNGERGWFVGAGGTVFVLAVIFAGALFLVHYRGSMGRLSRMNPPEASLVIADDGFTISSSAGASTLRWSAITEIWERPQYWLLFLSSAQFITVPTSDVPAQSLELLKTRIVAAGGKVG